MTDREPYEAAAGQAGSEEADRLPAGPSRRWLARGGVVTGGIASLMVGAVLGGILEGVPVLLPHHNHSSALRVQSRPGIDQPLALEDAAAYSPLSAPIPPMLPALTAPAAAPNVTSRPAPAPALPGAPSAPALASTPTAVTAPAAATPSGSAAPQPATPPTTTPPTTAPSTSGGGSSTPPTTTAPLQNLISSTVTTVTQTVGTVTGTVSGTVGQVTGTVGSVVTTTTTTLPLSSGSTSITTSTSTTLPGTGTIVGTTSGL